MKFWSNGPLVGEIAVLSVGCWEIGVSVVKRYFGSRYYDGWSVCFRVHLVVFVNVCLPCKTQYNFIHISPLNCEILIQWSVGGWDCSLSGATFYFEPPCNYLLSDRLWLNVQIQCLLMCTGLVRVSNFHCVYTYMQTVFFTVISLWLSYWRPL